MTYYVGDFAFDPLYLEHHGILGQKWGRRRFQNKDGSLTPAGRDRYGYYGNNRKKAAIVKGAGVAVSRRMTAEQAREAMYDDPKYQERWHKELKDYYDKGAPKDSKKYLEKMYGKEAYQHIGQDAKDEVSEIVAKKYYKDLYDQYSEADSSYNDVVKRLTEIGVDRDYLEEAVQDIAGVYNWYDSGKKKWDEHWSSETDDHDINRRAHDMLKLYLKIDVDGKDFRDTVHETKNREDQEYSKQKAIQDYFDEHTKIDWNKKDKSFSDLKKTWNSMLEDGRNNHDMPDLDSINHPFRKKMYELSGNPDRPKEAKGFNFKKAAEAVAKIREQSDGWSWQTEEKIDKIFAKAIAKDLGYTPTKETIEFFEQIMYSD